MNKNRIIALALALALVGGRRMGDRLRRIQRRGAAGPPPRRTKPPPPPCGIWRPGRATKDETVYVIANADGSVEKVIVSDW